MERAGYYRGCRIVGVVPLVSPSRINGGSTEVLLYIEGHNPDFLHPDRLDGAGQDESKRDALVFNARGEPETRLHVSGVNLQYRSWSQVAA